MFSPQCRVAPEGRGSGRCPNLPGCSQSCTVRGGHPGPFQDSGWGRRWREEWRTGLDGLTGGNSVTKRRRVPWAPVTKCGRASPCSPHSPHHLETTFWSLPRSPDVLGPGSAPAWAWGVSLSLCPPCSARASLGLASLGPVLALAVLAGRASPRDTAFHLQRLGPAFVLVAVLTVLHVLRGGEQKVMTLALRDRGQEWTRTQAVSQLCCVGQRCTLRALGPSTHPRETWHQLHWPTPHSWTGDGPLLGREQLGSLVACRQKGRQAALVGVMPGTHHTCSKGLLFCTPLAPTNTQLSRKASSLAFLLPSSLKSFLVSSFILQHGRKGCQLLLQKGKAEAGLPKHLLGGWVVIGCHEHQGAFVQWPNKLQQVVDIWGGRCHGTGVIRHH